MTTAVLSSGMAALDTLLGGGGFHAGLLTEICGQAGAGKSNLALSLLCQAQLPRTKGGLDSASVYISTEGSTNITTRRLVELATGLVDKYKEDEEVTVTTASVLDHVFIEVATTLEDQLDVIQCRLPTLLEAHNVKLVIVDSMAGVFRSELTGNATELLQRTKLMFGMANAMRILAAEYNAVFVLVNQVTSKPEDGLSLHTRSPSPHLRRDASFPCHIAPALGLAWSNCINQRLMLSKVSGGQATLGNHARGHDAPETRTPCTFRTLREAAVVFSPHAATGSCLFRIETHGLSSVT